MAIELNGFLAEGINRHDHNGEIRMLTFRCPGGKKHTHSIPTSDVNAFKYDKGSPFEDIEVWHRVFQNGKLVITPSIVCFTRACTTIAETNRRLSCVGVEAFVRGGMVFE